MIKNIRENIRNRIILKEDIKYIWNLKNDYELGLLNEMIKVEEEEYQVELESDIYYPTIFQIENNCPTCGYRTSIARQKYTEDFIVKNIQYKIRDLGKYNISGINCYNKDITGLRELFIILSLLEKYDLKINVRVSDYKNLEYLKKYNINSIIFSPQQYGNQYASNNLEDEDKYEEEIVKYIKENMNLKVTYQLMLYYNETHEDLFEKIIKIKKLGVDIIEIKGFDPFLDSPEEYNPQYSKEYILKILLLLKLYFNDKKIKIAYASNSNNYITDYLKLNINIFSGIYTPHLNSKLENIGTVIELIKK